MMILDKHSNNITLLMKRWYIGYKNYISLNNYYTLKTPHWNGLTTDAILHIKRKTINK